MIPDIFCDGGPLLWQTVAIAGDYPFSIVLSQLSNQRMLHSSPFHVFLSRQWAYAEYYGR